jgi:hypothetical protein
LEAFQVRTPRPAEHIGQLDIARGSGVGIFPSCPVSTLGAMRCIHSPVFQVSSGQGLPVNESTTLPQGGGGGCCWLVVCSLLQKGPQFTPNIISQFPPKLSIFLFATKFPLTGALLVPGQNRHLHCDQRHKRCLIATGHCAALAASKPSIVCQAPTLSQPG